VIGHLGGGQDFAWLKACCIEKLLIAKLRIALELDGFWFELLTGSGKLKGQDQRGS
jgi:hypothetical protein